MPNRHFRTLDLGQLARELDDLNDRVDCGGHVALTEDEHERRDALNALDSEIDLDRNRDEKTAIAMADKVAYAREYAEQVGIKTSGWPFDGNINWESAADDLLTDFTIFAYDGEDWAVCE